MKIINDIFDKKRQLKAVFEKLDQNITSSFLLRKFELPAFDAPFHFHPEFELTHIKKGEGQRYVGTQVEDFGTDDLIFLGSNLPHCWISKSLPEGETVEATVVQFKRDFLGSAFMELPEIQKIKALFAASNAGLKISGKVKTEILTEMGLLDEKDDYQKLLALLKILGILANSNDLKPIDPSFSSIKHSNNETIRFQRVFAYLIEHYREEISLEKIAEIAHLSPTSFCRYFKTLTGKTFLEIVNEYRIQYACQLLRKNELSVSQIAYESGFNDVPYFNKLFKKMKGVSPLGY
ncbi:AraC family transcriptional regulator [Lacihabitans sp. LS3-19]|uniref:AraC family transcriptional regulator n=1 Tax=Lacihabitans sp. LS3-19 TaxID=2487335 RepID=UPI0020CC8C67|nr:AraC family transcriptional regulator [Lacihabitans sp. LS3-19]